MTIRTDLGVSDPGDTTPTPSDRWDADPTDVAEQTTPVELDDDAYPHETHTDNKDDTDL